MLDFYKHEILGTFMSSRDVHGSFFDEADSFIEGGGGNHPWRAVPPPGECFLLAPSLPFILKTLVFIEKVCRRMALLLRRRL